MTSAGRPPGGGPLLSHEDGADEANYDLFAPDGSPLAPRGGNPD